MKPCEIASTMAFLAVVMSITSMVLIGLYAMKERK
jgi:hypothetical protein